MSNQIQAETPQINPPLPPIVAEDITQIKGYMGIATLFSRPEMNHRMAVLMAGTCDDLEWMWNKLRMSVPMDRNKCKPVAVVSADILKSKE